jgi:SAM-dependent methyltransferase
MASGTAGGQAGDLSAPEQEPSHKTQGDRYARVRGLIARAIGSFSRYGDLDTLYDPRGGDVLDYGWAGDGDRAVALIGRGARRVAGFDLWWTQDDLERVGELMRRAGVREQTDFRLADPYATPFPDDSFDIVMGGSILLHLELDRALSEIRRVLRPGGRGVFVEPLAGNPLLRLGRMLTRSTETEVGHKFTEAEWALCARHFPEFEHVERELCTIPLMPLNLLLPVGAQERLARHVWALDERLMARFPGLRKYARITFLILKKEE